MSSDERVRAAQEILAAAMRAGGATGAYEDAATTAIKAMSEGRGIEGARQDVAALLVDRGFSVGAAVIAADRIMERVKEARAMAREAIESAIRDAKHAAREQLMSFVLEGPLVAQVLNGIPDFVDERMNDLEQALLNDELGV